MKANLASTLVHTATLAALLALPICASAGENKPADRAADLLARQGTILVQNAGPYVEKGTFQIQVSTKLGRPTHRLADGTWLYAHYEVEDSDARGTLLVRFDAQGRVSELSLVTPAVATALAAPKPSPNSSLVAARR